MEKTFLGLQRRIFKNKGLWFGVWEDWKYEDDDSDNEDDEKDDGKNESSPKRFGTLIVFEDEFITDINSSAISDYR